MTSNSNNSHVEISIEKVPDKNKNKKISEIVCSPNLKHVCALHENNDISLWSIVGLEKLLTNIKPIHIDNIRTNEKIDAISDDKYDLIRKIFAISDDKQVSISLDRIDPYNFKIFDFETEEEIKLTFSDWQKEIDFLSFIDNGSIIMINVKYYRAYIFSSKKKDNMSWVCKSMIELQYFKKIYITPKGKLIIFNDTIYEITVWDIKNLSVKTRVLIEWRHILNHVEISDNEELLVICTENKKSKETNLYVFSTETGINLSTLNTKFFAIDRFHLIASSKGERLLYRSIQKSVKKYSLMDPYNLKNPINANKLFEHKPIQEQYIIKSDKIIYTNDGKVFIEQLWSLEINDESVKLIANKLNSSIKKQLDILPSLNINGQNYIVHCEVLENDDFITITRIGVIIWIYKLSGIKMHYYWNDCNCRLEKFVFEKINLNEDLFKDWVPGRILPFSNDKRIRLLGKSCIDKFVKENNFLISKISLLSIIFENFNELSENHPAFMTSALSLIGFVVPSTIVIPNSISLHLSKYGRYYHLYSTSFIDVLNSILRDRWISFQNSHPLFRDKIVKPIVDFYSISHNSIILAIPLPNLVSYPKKCDFWGELLKPSFNPFTFSYKLETINEEFYRYLNGEALIKFKWNTYGRKYYLTIWAIYTTFLLSFTIAVTYYKIISQTSLFILLNITIYLGFLHLLFELRQFIFSPPTYISSVWNLFDLGAYLLPMISSIIWLQNNVMPTEMATFSTLLLEIKFLLFFRAIEFTGAYFSTIIKVAQRAFSFLVILGFIVFAFAHSLHLLLRPAGNVSLDYPSYSTDPNDPWNLATTYNTIDHNGIIEENSSLIDPPTANTNMFMMMGSAISAVYLMLTGDSTSISYWDLNNNPSLLILTSIFSFVATIYLMNLFIGLLNNEIIETKTRESFLNLRAEILEEIELLYMLPHQRRKENWFPFVIFYECNTVKLREYIRDIIIGKWTGYKEPYISKALIEALQLPEDQPSFKQISNIIKNLEVDNGEIKKDVKALSNKIERVIKELNTLKTNRE
ncbi:transient receptor potential cation channel subfamily a member 1-like [Gigaspora margarita]|uniref:Transient receptor potential cation channel subfamily a member 1-like n=1 Tax=Gigaspora margarita TaxID=4874 RepID=A0A8H4ERP7_GIGMA|nr:transient receptor potential cation channel subfamily a member 1-like [Gigaspora margarita]